MSKLSKLLVELEFLQARLRWWRDELESAIPQERRREVEGQIEFYKKLEAIMTNRVIALQDCEHSEVEDTGGPDGSQVCLQCGRVS